MRATSTLGTKLERNLIAYATAASAAGIGLFGASSPSEAKVVYTPVHKVIPPGSDYKIDLNNDGTFDFDIVNSQTTSTGLITRLYERPLGQHNAVQTLTSQGWARALHKGGRVGPKKTFLSQRPAMMLVVDRGSTTSARGPWVNVVNRYLGLRFKIQGITHYGWARLTVQLDYYMNITATLTGYAYETIPHKAIVAGNRGSTTGQGPEAEPVSLGHLALGAATRKPQQSSRESSH